MTGEDLTYMYNKFHACLYTEYIVTMLQPVGPKMKPTSPAVPVI